MRAVTAMRELATPVVPRNARVEAAARDVNACGHRRAIGALIRAVQQPLGSRLARRRKRKGALHFRALDALFPLSEPMFLCSYNEERLFAAPLTWPPPSAPGGGHGYRTAVLTNEPLGLSLTPRMENYQS